MDVQHWRRNILKRTLITAATVTLLGLIIYLGIDRDWLELGYALCACGLGVALWLMLA